MERDEIQFLCSKVPLAVMWKARVDKGKTIKSLLEKFTQEVMEVWTWLTALERGSMDRVEKWFGPKSTRQLCDQSRNVLSMQPVPSRTIIRLHRPETLVLGGPIPYSYKISTSPVKHGFAGGFFFLVVLIENILIILPFKLSSPCKLLHLEWISYKVLRYRTGNYIVDLIIIHLEVESYVLFSGNF